MEKKIIPFLVLMCLTGCKQGSIMPNKDMIKIQGSAFNESFADISKDILQGKIMNEDTFLLFIYSPSCFSCNSFENILNSYIKQNHCLIYGINVDAERLSPDNSFSPYKVTPTLILYENGNIKERFDDEKNSEIFNSSIAFNNLINSKINVSNFYVLNDEDELNKLISSNGDIDVYFHLETCSDCTSFKKLFFNDYIENNEKVLYGFDMSKYFTSDEYYSQFTNKYGLSVEGNPTLGYRGGVVPTLQRYINGTLSDARIIYNDGFEREYSEFGDVLSMKVISSYYKDCPYINQIYVTDDKKTAREYYHEKTLSFFIAKVKEIY